MRAVSVLLTLALWAAVAAPASALECYACRESRNIAGVILSKDIVRKLAKFPTCEMLAEEGPSDKFKQTCSSGNRVCANIFDPKDDKNRVRTCFPVGETGCHRTACYCSEDLCNSSACVCFHGDDDGDGWCDSVGSVRNLLERMKMKGLNC